MMERRDTLICSVQHIERYLEQWVHWSRTASAAGTIIFWPTWKEPIGQAFAGGGCNLYKFNKIIGNFSIILLFSSICIWRLNG